jgi:tRNA modification GTPase
VGIVGKPNTGKSSLLNALLNYEKAIVSNIAGTTRDVVEGTIEINGVHFNFSDTAGIRESDDVIEELGVSLSKRVLDQSDILLFVIDGSEVDEKDNEIYQTIKDKNHIVAINKTDKSDYKDNRADVYISALKRQNVDALKDLLFERAVGGGIDLNGDFLCEERHFDALQRAKEKLLTALNAINFVTLDLLAIDIKDGWDALGEISGKTATEEVINNICEFCLENEFDILNLDYSPIKGPEGNIEYLIHIKKSHDTYINSNIDISNIVKKSHEEL